MFLLLIAAGAVYVALGDPGEAAALLVAIFVVIGLTLYQEQKTETALAALRDLSSPRALVVRDGVVTRIAGRDVVPGDLIVLREGDRVPADARVTASSHLSIDESLLTGESAPVIKRAATRDDEPATPGGDAPYVWSGTSIVGGDGRAVVIATGAATELGKIGRQLATLDSGATALQREVSRAVRWLALLGMAVSAVMAVVYGFARHNWLDGALSGLTLAISMVPEEFPVILTVFLALGAWRIARHHVLTRRLPAIEALGSATVLCVDKTGTLTLNRMTVTSITAGHDVFEVGADTRDLAAPALHVLATAIRASKIQAFDPMERAFSELGRQVNHSGPDQAGPAREYPLSDELLVVAHAWRVTGGAAAYDIAAKGAPEAVLAVCGLSDAERERIHGQLDVMAHSALRVLGVAEATWTGADLPASVKSFDFHFLGLVGLADPVRPGVTAAIDECEAAGVRVVMITGDHPSTAVAVAREAGLARPAAVLTGADVARMTDDELRQAVRSVDVFARIVPELKYRLVHALQANHDVVAMTGDGVNDGPALKSADIGIAMGSRGTDVAREAAALVLLDDDFTSIVRAIRLGRRIYDNIRKATGYVLAIHVPIAGMTLIPALLGWPLVLLPLHVVFMELLIDPACSVAFEMEPEEPGVMARPPRPAGERLFTRRLIARSLLQGAGVLAACFGAYAVARAHTPDELSARTIGFATVILTNIGLILSSRSFAAPLWSRRPEGNPAIRILVGGGALLLGLVMYVPALRSLLKLARPDAHDWLVVAGAAALALVWVELTKRVFTNS